MLNNIYLGVCNLKKWLAIISILLLLSGCSEEESKQKSPASEASPSEKVIDNEESINEENDTNQDTDPNNWLEKFSEAPAIEMSPEYLANQLQGPYAEFDFLEETMNFNNIHEAFWRF